MTASGKIICLGLSKTGTISLIRALDQLGYKAAHFVPREEFGEYEAIADTPIPAIFEELDREHPGARFILTVRSPAAWVRSFAEHYRHWKFDERYAGRGEPLRPDVIETHRKLYGAFEFDESRMLRGYHAYHLRVHSYFAERPGDLLMMDVTAGDGWELLCPFLRRPPPASGEEFPWWNRMTHHKAGDAAEQRKKSLGNRVRAGMRRLAFGASRGGSSGPREP